jgi:hypothetical protein
MQEPDTAHAEFVQDAERVPEYPELQIGVQVVPEAEFTRQSPVAALGITGGLEQAVLVQEPE